MVLVAGLLGVLYYLTFSGDSGAVNYSVKNKEAVTLILDCTQGARSNETLQDLTITYHCCRFVIVIVINVCPNPNCNYHQCRFQLLWKSLQASTIRDSTDGRGSRWAHHGLVFPQNIDPSSMKHASTVGGASRAGTVSSLLPGTYRTLACENVSSDRWYDGEKGDQKASKSDHPRGQKRPTMGIVILANYNMRSITITTHNHS